MPLNYTVNALTRRTSRRFSPSQDSLLQSHSIRRSRKTQTLDRLGKQAKVGASSYSAMHAAKLITLIDDTFERIRVSLTQAKTS